MGSGVSAFLQHHNMVTNTTVMPRSGIRSGGGNTNWTITREHDAPATRHEIGLDEGQRSQSVAGLNEGVQEGLTNLTIANVVGVNQVRASMRIPPHLARLEVLRRSVEITLLGVDVPGAAHLAKTDACIVGTVRMAVRQDPNRCCGGCYRS